MDSLMCLVISIFFTLPELPYGCYEGWTLFPRLQYCYIVISKPETWDHARALCHIKFHASLVQLLNDNEQGLIRARLLGSVKANGVWIGATDGEFPYQWKWIDGSAVNKSLYRWKPGNPNNNGLQYNGATGSEDCLEIETAEFNTHGFLNDYNCDERLPYICQMKAETTTTPTSRHISTTTTPTPRNIPDLMNSELDDNKKQADPLFKNKKSQTTTPKVSYNLLWVVCVFIMMVVIGVGIAVFKNVRKTRYQQRNNDENKYNIRNIIKYLMHFSSDNIGYEYGKSTENENNKLKSQKRLSEPPHCDVLPATTMVTVHKQRDNVVTKYTDRQTQTYQSDRYSSGSSYCDVLPASQMVTVHQIRNHEDTKYAERQTTQSNRHSSGSSYCDVLPASKMVTVHQIRNHEDTKYTDRQTPQYNRLSSGSSYCEVLPASQNVTVHQIRDHKVTKYTDRQTTQYNRHSSGSSYCDVLPASQMVTVHQIRTHEDTKYADRQTTQSNRHSSGISYCDVSPASQNVTVHQLRDHKLTKYADSQTTQSNRHSSSSSYCDVLPASKRVTVHTQWDHEDTKYADRQTPQYNRHSSGSSYCDVLPASKKVHTQRNHEDTIKADKQTNRADRHSSGSSCFVVLPATKKVHQKSNHEVTECVNGEQTKEHVDGKSENLVNGYEGVLATTHNIPEHMYSELDNNT